MGGRRGSGGGGPVGSGLGESCPGQNGAVAWVGGGPRGGGPKGWRPPKGGGPEGWRPRTVGAQNPEKVEARRVAGPKYRAVATNPREDSPREKKREKMGAGDGKKKSEILGGPAEGGVQRRRVRRGLSRRLAERGVQRWRSRGGGSSRGGSSGGGVPRRGVWEWDSGHQ